MPLRDATVPLLAAGLCAGAVLLGGDGCRRRTVSIARDTRDAAVENPAAAPIDPPLADEKESSGRPHGNVSFEVVDAETGAPIPCKLTFMGIPGTASPRFTRREVPVAIDGGVAVFDRVLSLAGHGSLRVPRGTYDIAVSHGLEWSMRVLRGVAIGTQPVNLRVELEHVIRTPEWVSADLHVHAAPSWDSDVPLAARVQEFAAEGVDILVATDHNVTTDYAPEIEKSGANRVLSSVMGTELSTVDWGHFGAFPIAPQPDWWALHGIRLKGGPSARELLHGLRQRAPGALITVNHPRLGKIGYFRIAEFDRRTARFMRHQGSLDFDAVEVVNGYMDAQREQVDQVLADWFSLILHGRRVTAVGNSDTHHLHTSLAGYPRNFVRVEKDDRPGALPGELLASSLRAGRSFLTTGPFVTFAIEGKGPGELVSAPGRPVKARIEVRAAPWVSVSLVRLYVDGQVEKTWSVDPSAAIDRFSDEVLLTPKKDAFVVVRVDGDRPLGPVVGGGNLPSIPPEAITNPVYLDVDGNGRYDAPFALAQPADSRQ